MFRIEMWVEPWGIFTHGYWMEAGGGIRWTRKSDASRRCNKIRRKFANDPGAKFRIASIEEQETNEVIDRDRNVSEVSSFVYQKE